MSEFIVNAAQMFNFFFQNLRCEVITREIYDREITYVAGILGRHALMSRSNQSWVMPADSLSDVFDNFVLTEFSETGAVGLQDPEILELAGSQVLLFVGFFRDQMSRRHNLAYYDGLGVTFFGRASERTKESEKSVLLRRVAGNFP